MLMLADTTVISNFALIERLDLLSSISGLCVTKEVWDELQDCKRKGTLKIVPSELMLKLL